MKLFVLCMLLSAMTFTTIKSKIRHSHNRELIASAPDTIKIITKDISTKSSKLHKNSSKLSVRSPAPRELRELKPKKHNKKPLKHSSKLERKLYEKYDPKKYVHRYSTYKKHIHEAKHHMLGSKALNLSKKLHDIKMREKIHRKLIHENNKIKPNSFKVNMKAFRKKQAHRAKMMKKHHRNHHNKFDRGLSKVVSDDAEEMNELETNEDDDGGNKLESIPLLLVGDYEIIIEKI